MLPDIPPLDEQAREAAYAAYKRQGISPGPDEQIAAQLVGITGRLDWRPTQQVAVICAADHGVGRLRPELHIINVGALLRLLDYPVSALSFMQMSGVRVVVVDAGTKDGSPKHDALITRKIAKGTADITRRAAMTPTQAEAAIQLGFDIAEQELAEGMDCLGISDMGMSSDVSALAIIAAMTDVPASELIDPADPQRAPLIKAVEKALKVNRPMPETALQTVGGFETGLMAGLIIGCAAATTPVILEGLMAPAAAMIAAQLCPGVQDYCFAGHRLPAPAHTIALETLGVPALRDDLLEIGSTALVLAFARMELIMQTLEQ